MRRGLIVLTVLLGVGIAGYAAAHWGGGYGGWGHMMGPGPQGYCGGYGSGPGAYEGAKAVTQEDAEAIARDYIGPNPNLKLGKIEERDAHFEAQIVTKDDSLVSKLIIDKNTGRTHPAH